jgi:hypothetical protein
MPKLLLQFNISAKVFKPRSAELFVFIGDVVVALAELKAQRFFV